MSDAGNGSRVQGHNLLLLIKSNTCVSPQGQKTSTRFLISQRPMVYYIGGKFIEKGMNHKPTFEKQTMSLDKLKNSSNKQFNFNLNIVKAFEHK